MPVLFSLWFSLCFWFLIHVVQNDRHDAQGIAQSDAKRYPPSPSMALFADSINEFTKSQWLILHDYSTNSISGRGQLLSK